MINLNSEFMHFPLPVFSIKKKIRIYGTGEVAGSYYRTIINIHGDQIVTCFIDSMNTKDKYYDKKVYSPFELDKETLNDFQYLLASYTSYLSMKAELLKVGIYEENIIFDKRFSHNSFLEIRSQIKTILFYPSINSLDFLENIENKINWYLPMLNNSQVVIKLISHQVTKSKISNINFIKNFDEFKHNETSLTIVWDKNMLIDDNIREKENVYCIDPTFFQFIDIKILLSLNNKIIESNLIREINNNSYKNFKKFYEKYNNAIEAYIFGNGPSILEGIKKYEVIKKSNSVRIVCNGIINNTDIIDSIKPNVYVISDINHFIYEAKEQMEKIIGYIDNNECILIIPDWCCTYIFYKYKNIKDKIVGLREDATDINFPNPNSMSVYAKAHNVITRFSITIASALSKNIYISGCDGIDITESNKAAFKHFNGTKSIVTKNSSDDTKQQTSYFKQHYKFFEEVILYGESIGKKYISLSKTYIPVLARRYFKSM